MTTVTVKLFGPQAALAQQREVVAEVASARPTAGEVLGAVASACPALAASIQGSRLAVNHAFVSADDLVEPNDEFALIGMLGGG